MSENLLIGITVFVLAVFVGIEVINRVPATLHTPLMSGTNAIHGIVLVGAMLVAALPEKGVLLSILAFLAVVLGTINVVGGFVVTDRMLQMFKKRTPPPGGK
jgi:NAD(P) transhydrogenase subunit alpha